MKRRIRLIITKINFNPSFTHFCILCTVHSLGLFWVFHFTEFSIVSIYVFHHRDLATPIVDYIHLF